MQAQMEAVQDTVEADCQNADCSYPHNPGTDSLTFLAYLQSCGASEMAIANASVWTRAMLGQESQDI
jgi:monoamine oxidase